MSKFTEIGKVLKPHGVHGELKCAIEEAYLETLLKHGIVYLKVGTAELPHFLEGIRSQDPFIIKFEDVDTKEDAVTIAHRALKMETKLVGSIIVEPDEDALEYTYMIGWEIEDKLQGKIGKIESVEDFPQQEMAILNIDEKEVYIPLNDQFISEIDKANKMVRMELPEGMISLGEEE